MKSESNDQNFCAVEISRIHEFPDRGMRDSYVRERSSERMSVCHRCAALIRARRRRLGREFEKTGGRVLNTGRTTV